ncbi:MAG: hypothetical protein ACXIVD_01135 [Salinarimonas sp.]
MTQTWMVRAGRGGRIYDLCRENGIIAIGWHELGSLAGLDSREALRDAVAQQWPDWTPQAIAISYPTVRD